VHEHLMDGNHGIDDEEFMERMAMEWTEAVE
jgi:hypothetical protein